MRAMGGPLNLQGSPPNPVSAKALFKYAVNLISTRSGIICIGLDEVLQKILQCLERWPECGEGEVTYRDDFSRG